MGETDMVWACTEKRCGVYWEKDAEGGVVGKEEQRKKKLYSIDIRPVC